MRNIGGDIGARGRPDWRGAWVELDPDALVGNVAALASLCPSGTDLMPVIKADAYGHGAPWAAHTLIESGSTVLCVATLAEAVALRRAGVAARLLCLYEPPPDAWPVAIEAGIELSIASVEGIDAALANHGRPSARVGFHLAVDTGMCRQGLLPRQLVARGRDLARIAGSVNAIWTHLADGADPASTSQQLARFDEAVAQVRGNGIEVPRHVAASAAILARLGVTYEGARPGMAIYGAIPSEFTARGTPPPIDLRPVMAVRAQAMRIETVPVGTAVGYGGTYITERRSRLATLPVGYADGLPRALGNGVGSIIVRGQRVPIVGRMSMDSCVVDVTGCPRVTKGTVFTMLGKEGRERITIEELALLSGTIPQDIAVRLGARLERTRSSHAVGLAGALDRHTGGPGPAGAGGR
ncbi:MAG TPA: alanine racemase [Candidatus Limnocylindrales bacterium]|nr:alanine racemase [Candidatus Limnocylindrales bacterium]